MHSVSVLRQRVKVIVDENDEKEIKEYAVEDLKFKRRHRREKVDLSPEELKELQRLEREDSKGGKSKLDDN